MLSYVLTCGMNFNNTNWLLYKTFILVYEARNMNKVAETMNVSRSAVSQTIKELGNQLGVTLFASSNKGVVPTSEANNLYPVIKDAITSIVEVENSLQAFTSESEAVIKIGVASLAVELYMLEFIKTFCIKYPKVRLEFFRRDLTDMLAGGKLDFVVEAESIINENGFRKIDLFTFNNILIASEKFLKEHSVNRKISENDFLRLPMISFHMWTESPKTFIIKSESAVMTHYMVKNSLGIGFFCQELFGKFDDTGIVTVEVENLTLPNFKIACGYTSLSRAAKTFIDEFKKTNI